MKIAFTADLHFRGGAYLPAIANAWRDAWEICAKHNVSHMIIAGDVFDSPSFALGRESTGGDVIGALLDPVLAHPGIEVVAFPGNHDLAGSERKSALEPLRAAPNVTVVESPRTVQLGDSATLLACLPWIWGCPRERVDTWLRRLGTEKNGARCKIIAMHAELDGARTRYVELPPGSAFSASPSALAACGADLAVAGHVHLRQEMPCGVSYIGSLIQQNWGEEDNPTGFMIYDTETAVKEWVRVDSPRHTTLQWDGISPYAVASPAAGGKHVRLTTLEPNGDRVRVVAPEKPSRPLQLPAGVQLISTPAAASAPRRGAGGTEYSPEPALLLQAWAKAKDWNAARTEAAAAELPPFAVLVSADSAREEGAIARVFRVRLVNIGPHVDRMVEFTDGIHAIVGPTGAGKTFILEAFAAAVWGEFPFYGPVADCVAESFRGEARVEAEWESATDGARYRSTRRIKSTGKTVRTEALLERMGGTRGSPATVAGPKISDVERELPRLAGRADRFIATQFQSQRDAGSIIDMDPDERMAFARRWVGADRWDAAAVAAKSARQALEVELAVVERTAKERDELERWVEAAREAHERSAATAVEATELRRNVAEYLNRKAALSEALMAVAKAERNCTRIAEALDTARLAALPTDSHINADDMASMIQAATEATQRVREIDANMERLKDVEDAKRHMADRLAFIERQRQWNLSQAESALVSAERSASMLSSAGCAPDYLRCPLIDDARVARDRVGAIRLDMAEASAATEEEIDLESGIALAQYAIQAWDRMVAERAEAQRTIADGETAARQVDAVMAQSNRAAAAAASIEMLMAESDRAEAALTAAKAVLDGMDSNLSVSLPSRFTSLAGIELEGAVRDNETSAIRADARAAADVDAAVKAFEQANMNALAAAGLANRLAALRDVEEFCGPRGGPQLLIDTALPRVNELLGTMMSQALPGMTAWLTTVKETKSGREREGLYLWVSDAAGKRPASRVSGGEGNVVRRVLRMALAEFEAERGGRRHGVYCVDEPTVGMDESLVGRLFGLITALVARTNQVVIVEHNPQLLSMMPPGNVVRC